MRRGTTVLRATAVAPSVRLVHEPADGSATTLATDVDVADSLLGKALGLMGRRTVPEDYALVFPFDDAAARSVHMILVRTAIDVVWTVDDRVERVETLPAWRGFARARADAIVELAPGTAEAVDTGDAVRLETRDE